MGTLFSPGKLLLTSEYVVLDGALALAVPTKLGQDLIFEEIEDGRSLVFWEGFHQNKIWLNAKINSQNWELIETNLPEAAAFVVKVLKSVQNLSASKFSNNSSWILRTNLQFPADYGLGSSSTLMNNLANWAGIDPFVLNDIALGGSGYDIAVAKEQSAVLFQILDKERTIEKVQFQPFYSKDLIFVHLNKKQDSREGIALYRSKVKSKKLIEQFSDITKQIYAAPSLEEFSSLLNLHEQQLASFLEIPTAKEKYFQDCPVFIKSLGAWGGDFILTTKFVDFEKYFQGKGFSTIYEWKDLIG